VSHKGVQRSFIKVLPVGILNFIKYLVAPISDITIPFLYIHMCTHIFIYKNNQSIIIEGGSDKSVHKILQGVLKRFLVNFRFCLSDIFWINA